MTKKCDVGQINHECQNLAGGMIVVQHQVVYMCPYHYSTPAEKWRPNVRVADPDAEEGQQ